MLLSVGVLAGTSPCGSEGSSLRLWCVGARLGSGAERRSLSAQSSAGLFAESGMAWSGLDGSVSWVPVVFAGLVTFELGAFAEVEGVGFEDTGSSPPYRTRRAGVEVRWHVGERFSGGLLVARGERPEGLGLAEAPFGTIEGWQRVCFSEEVGVCVDAVLGQTIAGDESLTTWSVGWVASDPLSASSGSPRPQGAGVWLSGGVGDVGLPLSLSFQVRFAR